MYAAAKMSKLEREKWFDAYSVDLALRPSEYGPTGVVSESSCLFVLRVLRPRRLDFH